MGMRGGGALRTDIGVPEESGRVKNQIRDTI
jgi:hypothetical protein